MDGFEDDDEKEDDSNANAPVPSESVNDKKRLHSTKLESNKLTRKPVLASELNKIDVHCSKAETRTQDASSKVKKQKHRSSPHQGNHGPGHVHPPPSKRRKTAKA